MLDIGRLLDAWCFTPGLFEDGDEEANEGNGKIQEYLADDEGQQAEADDSYGEGYDD